MVALIFIDTNIFLDFYRLRGRQGDLSLLSHIDKNHDRIITTSQVEMEFKKNRPAVVIESRATLKGPNWSALELPAYLTASKQSSGLDTGRSRIDAQLKTLQQKRIQIFEFPSRYDRVYKVAQRLFRSKTMFNLSREKKERFKIRTLARKRFFLGYPPRKAKDLSLGDAINWEWIVWCAQHSNADVVIVSRDSDYGIQLGHRHFINDWLGQEFRNRVNKKRKVFLTDRLSEGFKKAAISVTRAEEVREQEFLNDRVSRALPTSVQDLIAAINRHRSDDPHYLTRLIKSAHGMDMEDSTSSTDGGSREIE